MKSYKRILSLLVVLCLALSITAALTACNGEDADAQQSENKTDAPTEAPTSAPTDAPTDEPTDEPTEDTKETFTVYVKDADGNAIADVPVQICVGNSCRPARPTNAEGALSIDIDRGDKAIRVMITEVPEGFAVPSGEDVDAEGYCAEFAVGEFEVTVVLKAAA